jgi:hypothetical protein
MKICLAVKCDETWELSDNIKKEPTALPFHCQMVKIEIINTVKISGGSSCVRWLNSE